jgi:hypothetical protein
MTEMWKQTNDFWVPNEEEVKACMFMVEVPDFKALEEMEWFSTLSVCLFNLIFIKFDTFSGILL